MCTREEAREIAEVAATKAANDTLKGLSMSLGFDVTDPEEVRRFQANIGFIVRIRRMSEKVGSAIVVTIFVAMTSGIVALVWDKFHKGNGSG
ncbi:MAG: hypothetical protein KAJ10_11365 [Thermodesulfovibrionia bacterium]|nr:hypothetical protein [Thermodesulfovibrionia bacterium]